MYDMYIYNRNALTEIEDGELNSSEALRNTK